MHAPSFVRQDLRGIGTLRSGPLITAPRLTSMCVRLSRRMSSLAETGFLPVSCGAHSHMTYRRSQIVALGVTLCIVSACGKAPDAAIPAVPTVPTVDAGWLLPVPAGEMAAIYFTIHNPTATPLVLTGVNVTGIAHSTFHESTEHNGMAHMSDKDSLVVPAQDSIVFAPRGLHVMAHGVPKSLAIGDSLMISITTRSGQPLQTRASVRQ